MKRIGRGAIRAIVACAAGLAWAEPASAQTAPPADGPAKDARAAAATTVEQQIGQLRAEQEAAIAQLRAEQDAAIAKMQAANDAALAALAQKQEGLDRKLAEVTAQQAQRDKDAAEAARARASEPAPGVTLSLLGVPVHVFGSLALRYDYSTNSNLTDSLTNGIQANWLLTRIRLGAEFGDTGPVVGGIRLSSGSPSPTVPYIVLSNAFRSASFGVDQAWAAVRPLGDRDRLQLAIGRIKNPFWRGSIGTVRTQMIWDDDVNPAGAALTGQLYKAKSQSGAPVVFENALSYMQLQALLDTRFVGLTGVASAVGDQLRLLSKYVDAAVAYYAWWNLNTGLSVPTAQPAQGYVSPQPASSAYLLGVGLQRTNTQVNYGPAGGAATGFLDSTFQVLNPTVQAHVTFKNPDLGDPDAYLLLDYAHDFLPSHALTAQGNLATPNPATCKSCTTVAGANGQGRDAAQLDDGFGVTIGTRLGDKTYERALHPLNVWGTFRYVQSDATLATFTDSDLGAGTGYHGFGVGVNYRIFKNLMASVQYFDFFGYPLMENHVQRLFTDLVGDF